MAPSGSPNPIDLDPAVIFAAQKTAIQTPKRNFGSRRKNLQSKGLMSECVPVQDTQEAELTVKARLSSQQRQAQAVKPVPFANQTNMYGLDGTEIAKHDRLPHGEPALPLNVQRALAKHLANQKAASQKSIAVDQCPVVQRAVAVQQTSTAVPYPSIEQTSPSKQTHQPEQWEQTRPGEDEHMNSDPESAPSNCAARHVSPTTTYTSSPPFKVNRNVPAVNNYDDAWGTSPQDEDGSAPFDATWVYSPPWEHNNAPGAAGYAAMANDYTDARGPPPQDEDPHARGHVGNGSNGAGDALKSSVPSWNGDPMRAESRMSRRDRSSAQSGAVNDGNRNPRHFAKVRPSNKPSRREKPMEYEDLFERVDAPDMVAPGFVFQRPEIKDSHPGTNGPVAPVGRRGMDLTDVANDFLQNTYPVMVKKCGKAYANTQLRYVMEIQSAPNDEARATIREEYAQGIRSKALAQHPAIAATPPNASKNEVVVQKPVQAAPRLPSVSRFIPPHMRSSASSKPAKVVQGDNVPGENLQSTQQHLAIPEPTQVSNNQHDTASLDHNVQDQHATPIAAQAVPDLPQWSFIAVAEPIKAVGDHNVTEQTIESSQDQSAAFQPTQASKNQNDAISSDQNVHFQHITPVSSQAAHDQPIPPKPFPPHLRLSVIAGPVEDVQDQPKASKPLPPHMRSSAAAESAEAVQDQPKAFKPVPPHMRPSASTEPAQAVQNQHKHTASKPVPPHLRPSVKPRPTQAVLTHSLPHTAIESSENRSVASKRREFSNDQNGTADTAQTFQTPDVTIITSQTSKPLPPHLRLSTLAKPSKPSRYGENPDVTPSPAEQGQKQAGASDASQMVQDQVTGAKTAHEAHIDSASAQSTDDARNQGIHQQALPRVPSFPNKQPDVVAAKLVQAHLADSQADQVQAQAPDSTPGFGTRPKPTVNNEDETCGMSNKIFRDYNIPKPGSTAELRADIQAAQFPMYRNMKQQLNDRLPPHLRDIPCPEYRFSKIKKIVRDPYTTGELQAPPRASLEPARNSMDPYSDFSFDDDGPIRGTGPELSESGDDDLPDPTSVIRQEELENCYRWKWMVQPLIWTPEGPPEDIEIEMTQQLSSKWDRRVDGNSWKSEQRGNLLWSQERMEYARTTIHYIDTWTTHQYANMSAAPYQVDMTTEPFKRGDPIHGLRAEYQEHPEDIATEPVAYHYGPIPANFPPEKKLDQPEYLEIFYNQTSQGESDVLMAKRYAESDEMRESRLTTQKLKAYRRQNKEAQLTIVKSRDTSKALTGDHPWAVLGKIHIRPLENSEDIHQMVRIFNYYVMNSIETNRDRKVTAAEMRVLVEKCFNAGYPVLVAILRVDPGDAPVHGALAGEHRPRDHGQHVVGFTWTSAFNAGLGVYKDVAHLRVFVSPQYTSRKVGANLIDRAIGCIDRDYQTQQGAEIRMPETDHVWNAGWRLPQTILVDLNYCDLEAADVQGKKQFLEEKFGFVQTGNTINALTKDGRKTRFSVLQMQRETNRVYPPGKVDENSASFWD